MAFIRQTFAVASLLLLSHLLVYSHALDVACTVHNNTCHITTPVYLLDNQYLNIVDTGDLSNVTRFELNALTNLAQIPPTVWSVFPKLEELVLADFARISEISAIDFIFASKLHSLNLRGNKILTILYTTFALAPELQFLDISYNNLIDIDELAFNGCSKLLEINLSFNRINSIKQFTFSGLPNLQTLDLSHNKIKLIEDGALNLPSLRFLSLNTNDLKTLPDGLFSISPLQSPPLEIVDFGENKLTHIGDSFNNLQELKLLNFTSNKKIDDLNLAELAKLQKLEQLLLSNTGFQFPTIIFNVLSDATNPPTPSSDSPLKKLFLAKNKLTNPDILKQLAYFRQLEVLSLEENRFTHIDNVESLSTWFPYLHTIYIGENKLNCDWLNASLPLFQQADVSVYTIAKVKTNYGTTYQRKLIDMDDCFDLNKIFNNILYFLNKFSTAL